MVHTWLKRATIYSHIGLLEQNVHMVWTRFASGLANQKQAAHCLHPQGEKAALLLMNHHT